MDPDSNLHEQIRLAAQMAKDYQDPNGNGIDQDDANRLAGLVLSLHKWICNSGTLPVPWQSRNCNRVED